MRASVQSIACFRTTILSIARIAIIGIALIAISDSQSARADSILVPSFFPTTQAASSPPSISVAELAPGIVAVHIQGDDHYETVQVAPDLYVARSVPTVHLMPMNSFTSWIQSVAETVLSLYRWTTRSCWDLVHDFANWFIRNMQATATFEDTPASSFTCIDFIDVPVVCTLKVTTSGKIDLSVNSR